MLSKCQNTIDVPRNMLQQDGPFNVPTPPARRHLSQTQADLQTPLDPLCLLYSSHSGPFIRKLHSTDA